MKNSSSDEESLKNKLQLVADGHAVELTKKEAILFGTDVADILPEEDSEAESEVYHG